MLDLRLRMTEGDAPDGERNEDGDEGDKAGSRQRPDRLQTLILALLAMLIFLAIGLVTYLAVWVITETDSSEPQHRRQPQRRRLLTRRAQAAQIPKHRSISRSAFRGRLSSPRTGRSSALRLQRRRP